MYNLTPASTTRVAAKHDKTVAALAANRDLVRVGPQSIQTMTPVSPWHHLDVA